MNLLVTGSAGQLGQKIQEVLSSGVCEIGTIPDEYKKQCNIMNTGISDLDITDRELVNKVFHEFKPKIVLNCAAYTDVDGSESNKQVAMHVNALGVKNIAEASENVGAKLIHMSTDYVFDGKKNTPYQEQDSCNPINVYGHSKLNGEKLALQYCSRTFILRTGWLYSIYSTNFFKTIFHLAYNNNSINVVNDQVGSPTNADDLVYHVLKLSLTDRYGIYHFGGNGECSWYDFACKIVELARFNCHVEPVSTEKLSRPAKRPKYSYLDNKKIDETIGDKMNNWIDVLEKFMYKYKEVLYK